MRLWLLYTCSKSLVLNKWFAKVYEASQTSVWNCLSLTELSSTQPNICWHTCTFYILGILKLLFKVLCFVWYKFQTRNICYYFHSKECFPLVLLHINTNPHAPTLNFLSVRLFLCHTVRNSRGKTMSKQLSNWTLLGNSPSSLYNDSGLWPARRRVTHTLTNISQISIHNHQGSFYTTNDISACCPTQSTPNALWSRGIRFTTKSMFCAKNRQQQSIL